MCIRDSLNGDAHIAVHSLKDMEVNIAKDTFIGAIHSRDSRNDVLLGKYKSLSDLPKNAIIGTTSPRRTAFLKYFRNDLTVKLCRGNVESRISKLNENKYDALVLAEAGLNRLDINYSCKIPIKFKQTSAFDISSANLSSLNMLASTISKYPIGAWVFSI